MTLQDVIKRHAAHGTLTFKHFSQGIIPYREPKPVAVGAEPAPWQHGLHGAASHPGNPESMQRVRHAMLGNVNQQVYNLRGREITGRGFLL